VLVLGSALKPITILLSPVELPAVYALLPITTFLLPVKALAAELPIITLSS